MLCSSQSRYAAHRLLACPPNCVYQKTNMVLAPLAAYSARQRDRYNYDYK
jgi:hypothetical protein